jgi:sugar lactone lactonase YvrE
MSHINFDDYELEVLADYACHTGEGPLYHPDENRVYWTDIPNGKLFRYDIATGTHEVCYEGEPVGGMTLQEDGSLLLFGARGAVRVWRDGVITPVIEEMPEEKNNRFNDVIAAPDGSVFCGVMSTPERAGRLYHLATDGEMKVLVEGTGTANGMGFTPDRDKMYFTDTHVRKIYLFDYDRKTGEATNQRLWVETPDDPEVGRPDGMTVDAYGNVWSGRWGGSRLVCHGPDGVEKGHIPFPVKKISCVTFGGPNYADMYITTAGGHIKDTDGEHAGALFRLRMPGAWGVAEFRSNIGK